VVSSDLGDLQAPIVGVRQAAMQEDDGFALAKHGVPQFDAVDRRIAAAIGLRQRRGGRQGQPARRGGPRPTHPRQSHREKRGTTGYHVEIRSRHGGPLGVRPERIIPCIPITCQKGTRLYAVAVRTTLITESRSSSTAWPRAAVLSRTSVAQ